jgi:hypothetical protein
MHVQGDAAVGVPAREAGTNAATAQESASAPQGAQACGAKRYCKQMVSCEEARVVSEPRGTLLTRDDPSTVSSGTNGQLISVR